MSFLKKVTAFFQRKLSQQHRFDQQYTAHKWDGLRTAAEEGRYKILAGYIQKYTPGGRILDLGCGEGILLEKLSTDHFSQYTGVDFSKVAIDNANKENHPKATFIVGDLNNLDITGVYDVIIYNESLYYLSDPLGAVQKLFPHLSATGIFLFSIVDKHGKVQTKYWEVLCSKLTLLETNQVKNDADHSWTVNAYKKK